MSMLDDIRRLMAEMEAEDRAHEAEAERVLGIARSNGWGVFASPDTMWATPHVKRGTVIVSTPPEDPLRNFEFRPRLPPRGSSWLSPVYIMPGMSLNKPIDIVTTNIV